MGYDEEAIMGFLTSRDTEDFNRRYAEVAILSGEVHIEYETALGGLGDYVKEEYTSEEEFDVIMDELFRKYH